jgi:cellulose synthase/poly-beta-1,6-N-acetylglucosamine synthase-like glycosyltransferase
VERGALIIPSSISIVVATYSAERERDIAELLASVAGQDFPDQIEVVLVVEGGDSLISRMHRVADAYPTPHAKVRNAWGVNMAFRKWILDRVAFDERFGGEHGCERREQAWSIG